MPILNAIEYIEESYNNLTEDRRNTTTSCIISYTIKERLLRELNAAQLHANWVLVGGAISFRGLPVLGSMLVANSEVLWVTPVRANRGANIQNNQLDLPVYDVSFD